MEKLQVIWDKKSNYLPAKVDTKFYLLNGSGKPIALVDETPDSWATSSKPDEEDMPEVTFFTNGGQIPCALADKMITVDNHPISYYSPLNKTIKFGRGRFNYKSTPKHPSKADGKWLTVLLSLEGPPELDTTHQNSKGQNEDDTNEHELTIGTPTIGLMDMPLEVFEVMVPHLDGLSFLTACSADQMLESLIWGGLGTNRVNCWRYWRNTCVFDINRQQMLMVLSSYDGILERQSRLDPGSEHPFIPIDDALDNHSWEDVCRSVWTMWDTLYTGTLEVKNMTNLENKIKTDLQMTRIKENTDASTTPITANAEKPTRITQSSGSTIYNLMSPWEPSKVTKSNLVRQKRKEIWFDHIYIDRVMEDLDRCEVRRIYKLCKKRVLYVKLMYIPQFKVPSDNPGPGLPRVVRILISVCSHCVYLVPLQEGKGRQIDLDAGNYDHRQMDPILAIHENFFCVWGPPFQLVLYRCFMSERGVEADTIRSIEIYHMLPLWNRVADNREFYIPTLEKRKGSLEAASSIHYKFFTLEELQEDYFEFKLISLRFGVDIISTMNPIQGTLADDDGKPVFLGLHQFPQYYMENAKEFRDALDMPYCGAQGYGIFVVWNDKAVGISWDGLTWIFQSWKNAFESAGSMISMTRNVSHIEVASPGFILVAVNGNIIILSVQKISGQVVPYKNSCSNPLEKSPCSSAHLVATEPQLILSAVRVIRMKLPAHGLELELMTFDYDKGDPYIFLTLRKKESTSDLDFFIKRLCFSKNGEGARNVKKETVPERLKNVEKIEKPIPFLTKEPRLFDLCFYPKVRKRVEELLKMKADGIPEPKPSGPAPVRRPRFKGETREHYHNVVLVGKTDSRDDAPATTAGMESFLQAFSWNI